MRGSSTLSEAWRNLRTGTTRALLLALILAGVGGTLAAADALTITGIQAKAEQFFNSGAAIRTLVADGQIEGHSCDALSSAATTTAAGALAAADPITLSALPGNSIPAFVVTPDLGQVLGLSNIAGTGVWVSDQLAATLRAEQGSILPTSVGPLTISGVFAWPDDGRDSRLSYAILIPSATQPRFDECWATIWPSSTPSDELLRSAAAVQIDSTTPLNLSQVNKNHGTSFDGNAEYRNRLTRAVPLVSGFVGLLLGYAAARARRLEYAGALHAGARKPAIVATTLAEALAWTSAGTLIATAALIAVARAADPGGVESILLTDIRCILAAAVAALSGSGIALLGIRERHLFRYFKDR